MSSRVIYIFLAGNNDQVKMADICMCVKQYLNKVDITSVGI